MICNTLRYLYNSLHVQEHFIKETKFWYVLLSIYRTDGTVILSYDSLTGYHEGRTI